MNKRIFILGFLALGLATGTWALDYGGDSATIISGNTVVDLYFDPADSNLFVLSSAGLSYTNARSSAPVLTWKNFGDGTFQDGLLLSSLAAGRGTLVVAGFLQNGQEYRGGQIYVKSGGSPWAPAYYPSFKDGDDFKRLPYDVFFKDSTFYVSMYSGTVLKNRIPLPAGGWRAILVESAAVTALIAENRTLAEKLAGISDSLLQWIRTDSLPGDSLIRRLSAATDSAGDSLFSALHFHHAGADTASFFVDWLTFRFDTAGKFIKDTLHLTGPVAGAPDSLDSLASLLIPGDTLDLLRYGDSLRTQYDSLISEIAPNLYPPPGYSKSTSLTIYAVNGRDRLLMVGTSEGLKISVDGNRTFTEMLHFPGSPLPANSEVSDIFIQAFADSSFRVWVRTPGDTVAYSARIPNSQLTADSLRLVHGDSLKKWTLFEGDFNLTDLEFFNDTVFAGFGSSGRDGLRKYYEIDTLKSGKRSRQWRFQKMVLSGFIEPQLGINTLMLIPMDTSRYDLWAGTDDGLYRLHSGEAVWTRFEYKKSLGNSSRTYAYPTVIQPGYKSAKIAYSLDGDARVTIEIFDFSMRKVKTLIRNEFRPKGKRSDNSERDRWDGRDDVGRPAAAGVYYYKISAGSKRLFGKIMVFGAKDY